MAKNAAVDSAAKLAKEGKHDEAIAALDAEYKKSPKAAEVKTALISTLMGKGDSLMNDPNVPPRMKYPGALRAYRRVVELDPANAKAKSQISTIEGIYKSMGRPVPQ